MQDLNAVPARWAGYFRIGNSARSFDKIMNFTVDRLALFMAKLHRRSRRYGWFAFHQFRNRLGLVNLNGLVVAPRPNQAWRVLVRTPQVKDVGEPGAGEPHARFDGGELEKVLAMAADHGGPRETEGPEPGTPTARYLASSLPDLGQRVRALERMSRVNLRASKSKSIHSWPRSIRRLKTVSSYRKLSSRLDSQRGVISAS